MRNTVAQETLRTAALVVAAGSGARAGAHLPKQYVEVAGKPLLRHALEPFMRHARVDMVQVVVGSGQEELFAQATQGLELPAPVIGGATRQQSVLNGLRALATLGERAPEAVLIHDAARPFLPTAIIDALLATLGEADGGLPALEVVDTIKRVDEHGIIVETPPRASLRAAQTPQAFRMREILSAHEAVAGLQVEFSDDAQVAEHAGMKVKAIMGAAQLRKITHAEDFRWAAEMAAKLAGDADTDT